jgi:Spy/CpxP family protein refolding chaperone
MAETLLKLDSDPLWQGMFQGQDLTPEQIEHLRRQVREDLERVEGRGRRERDALVRVVEAVVSKVLSKGEPS